MHVNMQLCVFDVHDNLSQCASVFKIIPWKLTLDRSVHCEWGIGSQTDSLLDCLLLTLSSSTCEILSLNFSICEMELIIVST